MNISSVSAYNYTPIRQTYNFGKKKTISDIPKTDEQNFIKYANHLYYTAITEFKNLDRKAQDHLSSAKFKGNSILHYDKDNELIYESKNFQNGSKLGTSYKFSYNNDFSDEHFTAVVYCEGSKRTKVEITTPKGMVTLSDLDPFGGFHSASGTMNGKTFNNILIDR